VARELHKRRLERRASRRSPFTSRRGEGAEQTEDQKKRPLRLPPASNHRAEAAGGSIPGYRRTTPLERTSGLGTKTRRAAGTGWKGSPLHKLNVDLAPTWKSARKRRGPNRRRGYHTWTRESSIVERGLPRRMGGSGTGENWARMSPGKGKRVNSERRLLAGGGNQKSTGPKAGLGKRADGSTTTGKRVAGRKKKANVTDSAEAESKFLPSKRVCVYCGGGIRGSIRSNWGGSRGGSWHQSERCIGGRRGKVGIPSPQRKKTVTPKEKTECGRGEVVDVVESAIFLWEGSPARTLLQEKIDVLRKRGRCRVVAPEGGSNVRLAAEYSRKSDRGAYEKRRRKQKEEDTSCGGRKISEKTESTSRQDVLPAGNVPVQMARGRCLTG